MLWKNSRKFKTYFDKKMSELRAASETNTGGNSQGNGDKKKNVKCWKCGKRGHLKSNCSERNNVAKDEDEEISVMSSEKHKRVQNFLWVGDSGSTCTMGPSLDGCSNIVEVEEKTVIGNRKQV